MDDWGRSLAVYAIASLPIPTYPFPERPSHAARSAYPPQWFRRTSDGQDVLLVGLMPIGTGAPGAFKGVLGIDSHQHSRRLELQGCCLEEDS